MRFDNAFLDEIRDRVPISTVIGQRVTWDRRKTNARRGDYWAPCPFHGEKSPSFHCEDKKGRYHCFGCGASGDVFRFLTEYEGRKFADAVEIVADLAGVALPERGPLTDEDKRRIAERQEANAKERARRIEEAEQERQQRTLSAGQVLLTASRRTSAASRPAASAAAALVAWTGQAWPDLLVAGVIALLFLHSAYDIIRDARKELTEHGRRVVQ